MHSIENIALSVLSSAMQATVAATLLVVLLLAGAAHAAQQQQQLAACVANPSSPACANFKLPVS